MLVVGKTVDYRDRAVLCKIYDVLVSKSPDHDSVYHSGEDLGRVVDSLAATDLDVVVTQEERRTAELVHTDLERYTCPCGGLCKDHGERLAVEIVMLDAGLCHFLHILSDIEEIIEVFKTYVFMKIYVVLHFLFSLSENFLLWSLKDRLECLKEALCFFLRDDERRCDPYRARADRTYEEAC